MPITSVELTAGDKPSNSGIGTHERGTLMNTAARQLRVLAAAVVLVGGALGGCSGSSPAPTTDSPTPSTPAGYVLMSQSEVRGQAPYACGGVDLPQMVFGRVNQGMRAEQVDTVTICRNSSKAKFTTYLTPQAPNWATIDGYAATTEQVQALLDVLAAPDEVTDVCIGAPPAVDPLYLTLTDGTVLQPDIPTSVYCDRPIEAARQAVNGFPWGGPERG